MMKPVLSTIVFAKTSPDQVVEIVRRIPQEKIINEFTCQDVPYAAEDNAK